LIRILNEMLPGFAGLVAASRGKSVDEITFDDIVLVVESIYGEAGRHIVNAVKRRLCLELQDNEAKLGSLRCEVMGSTAAQASGEGLLKAMVVAL